MIGTRWPSADGRMFWRKCRGWHTYSDAFMSIVVGKTFTQLNVASLGSHWCCASRGGCYLAGLYGEHLRVSKRRYSALTAIGGDMGTAGKDDAFQTLVRVILKDDRECSVRGYEASFD